ncbi:unnamed protein product [Cladocopium goreaui]|uniref:Ankyrin repeat domain-containing protein 22 n=1 Tax=Cladocopium goreaui TaxID=2562237 RepID=A0A9P1FIV8_9DINO|nr:unnamed protein product [Cladocopium goreaui]
MVATVSDPENSQHSEREIEIRNLSGEVLCTLWSKALTPEDLKVDVHSATDIPPSFFEFALMDNDAATIILKTDCPWDMVLDLAGRDLEGETSRLTTKILQLCQHQDVALEKHMIEAIQNGDEKMVEVFLENGFSPNHPVLPLHVCAKVGSIETMRALLQARAEVNVQNSDGDTPLHFACQRRDATFAELLLNQGADPWQRNDLGERPDVHFEGFETDDSDREEPTAPSETSSVCSLGSSP